MKKSIFSICLFFIFSISISSCKKDNSEDSNGNNSIVGKWSVVSYAVSNFENTGTTYDGTNNLASRPIFEFKTDGTFIDNLINGNTRTTKYTILVDKVTFDVSLAYETHNSFTYNISGTTMTLKRTDTYTYARTGTFTETTIITLKRI